MFFFLKVNLCVLIKFKRILKLIFFQGAFKDIFIQLNKAAKASYFFFVHIYVAEITRDEAYFVVVNKME